ncbi:hypothetical protein TRFO_10527 [Tritrichomonas foetus]|uniref:Uncharacterized protein n=1 Tax=Tritrichomonas foetus TaxID=1144522 RepID=A0A1J4J8C5_9EUKA|nr:hypothetical protein TRFO_10527 [Tritrichomonas foetus]|eukprot:OHS95392.1 hypothetical protein TRFO_10527 [Tritrichomonas foetus]
MAEAKAKTALSILISTIRPILQKVQNTNAQVKNTMQRNIASQNFQAAFDNLNTFCCKYEQERATGFLLECTKTVQSHISEILAGNSCPGEYDLSVTILCYSRKFLHIPQLLTIVDDVFTKKWGKATIEAMTYSEKVPDMMNHLSPRDSFTLEELHMFVHRFEGEMKMDFTWFYNYFPVTNTNLPDSVSHVKVLGRKVSMNTVEPPKPPPKEISRNASKTLPPLIPFTNESYVNMVKFVDKSLQGWNTWRFVVDDQKK